MLSINANYYSGIFVMLQSGWGSNDVVVSQVTDVVIVSFHGGVQ